MKSRKKLNLLPAELKMQYANRYLIYASIIMLVLITGIITLQYARIGVLSWQTNKIIEGNDEYSRQKDAISELEESIAGNTAFLDDYNSGCFPFSLFMYDLESLRPEDVYLISVDSRERLINEGVPDDKEEKPAESDSEQNAEAATEPSVEGKIEYTDDLTGREIVIRGFGGSQDTISKYIYAITHLDYIGSANVTAIEEHTIENGKYNIFEIIVTGGAF